MKKLLRAAALFSLVCLLSSSLSTGALAYDYGKTKDMPAPSEPVEDSEAFAEYVSGFVGKTYQRGYCQMFVQESYLRCFGKAESGKGCCATNAYTRYCKGKHDGDRNVPVGAAVYFSGSRTTCGTCGKKAGHVGIYVGDDTIVHVWSGNIRAESFSAFESNHGGYSYRGWGWQGNHEILQYAPPEYVKNECAKFPSRVNLTVSVAGNMKSLPCSSATRSDSETLKNLTPGESYTAAALYTNPVGNCWYAVRDNGRIGFIYAGDVTVTFPDASAIVFRDLVLPENVKKGGGFGLRGKLSSPENKICSVACNVYPGSDTSAEPVLFSEQNVFSHSFDLNGSAINKEIQFGSLANGSYTLVYSVSLGFYSSYGQDLGELRYPIVTKGFTVSSSVKRSAAVASIAADGSAGKTSAAPVKPTATPKPTTAPTATPRPTAAPAATPRPAATAAPTEEPFFEVSEIPGFMLNIPDSIDVNAPEYATDAVLPSGQYVIVSSLDENYALDAERDTHGVSVNLCLGEWKTDPQSFDISSAGQDAYGRELYHISRISRSLSVFILGDPIFLSAENSSSGANAYFNSSFLAETTDKWRIEPAGDGSYFIILANADTYLDVDNAYAAVGTNVKMFDRNEGYLAQNSKFIRIS